MTGQVELPISEAAVWLGISEDAVRARIKRGTLKAKRQGGRVFVVFEPSPRHPARRIVASNPETTPEIDEARREIERFCLHLSQLKHERDHLIVRVEELERLLAEEQKLGQGSQNQMERLLAFLAEAFPETTRDPQDGAEQLWRRLEQQVKRLNKQPANSSEEGPPPSEGQGPAVSYSTSMHNERIIPDAFLATWRIREVSDHTRDEIDRSGRAMISFEKDGGGFLKLLGVDASIDCRTSTRGGSTFVDFTWAGTRNGSPASGRGWAHILKTGGMMGHLWAHGEGDANFTAVRQKSSWLPKMRT